MESPSRRRRTAVATTEKLLTLASKTPDSDATALLMDASSLKVGSAGAATIRDMATDVVSLVVGETVGTIDGTGKGPGEGGAEGNGNGILLGFGNGTSVGEEVGVNEGGGGVTSAQHRTL